MKSSIQLDVNRTSLKRDGSVLTFQYDVLNRMTAKLVPERAGLTAAQTRDVHYEYDLRGLQSKARFDSLAGEGITNGYDGFGLLVSSSSNMGGVARATGNLYDLDGNRIRVIHPDTSFFTYEVDGLGRPFRIRENGGDPIATFAYDAAGRRVSSGYAATTSYAYDPVGRLQTLSHNLAGTSRDHDLGFTYNSASQPPAWRGRSAPRRASFRPRGTARDGDSGFAPRRRAWQGGGALGGPDERKRPCGINMSCSSTARRSSSTSRRASPSTRARARPRASKTI